MDEFSLILRKTQREMGFCFFVLTENAARYNQRIMFASLEIFL